MGTRLRTRVYQTTQHGISDIDMVLHLAAFTEDSGDWDGQLDITAKGTVNVFRAAQEAGIWRVVNMSTGSTMCGLEWYEGSGPLPEESTKSKSRGQQSTTWILFDRTHPTAPPRCSRRPRPDAISDNSTRWRDTSHAEDVIGWKAEGVI